MAKRIVITGGGGFIGAYLVKRLVADGWDVAVDPRWCAATPAGSPRWLRDVELFACDVRDQDALEKAFNGAEVVMHLAAINGTENFYKQPGTRARRRVAWWRARGGQRGPRRRRARSWWLTSTAEVYQTPAGGADAGDRSIDAAGQPQP